MTYALLYMDVHAIGFISLTAFPFPYKYLLGVGFYFYIKSLIDAKEKVIQRWEYFFFLPAVSYGLLRLYWYISVHSGIDKYLFYNVYQSG
ncbi:MAG: hypothetical protein AB8G22_17820, partial [Saprospiraceae bacterium]